MVIAVIVIVWIVVLTPIAIRRLRDHDTDRSIVNFHEHMARLGNGTPPLVTPAHRLDVSDETPPREVREYEMNPPTRAPQLRVVPVGATVRDVEQELSWEEWSLAHSDEPHEAARPRRELRESTNHRAAAYAQVPTATAVLAPPVATASSFGSRSQRARRRRSLLTLATSVVISSVMAFFLSSTLIDAWALVSWVALASFLGLMYYAMSSGLMKSSTRASQASRVRLVSPRREQVVTYNEFDLAFDPSEDDEFANSTERRYAQAQ